MQLIVSPGIDRCPLSQGISSCLREFARRRKAIIGLLG
jgi:hypothetical protein